MFVGSIVVSCAAEHPFKIVHNLRAQYLKPLRTPVAVTALLQMRKGKCRFVQKFHVKAGVELQTSSWLVC